MLNSNQKLDFVLQQLNEQHDKQYKIVTVEMANGTTVNTWAYSENATYLDYIHLCVGAAFLAKQSVDGMPLILDYLKKKELIQEKQTPNGRIYAITFEGKKLIEDGGFNGLSSRNKNQTRYEKLRDHYLIVGSWIAGIGTIGLVIVDLLDKYHMVVSIQTATLLCVLLGGMILGVILYQLLKPMNQSTLE